MNVGLTFSANSFEMSAQPGRRSGHRGPAAMKRESLGPEALRGRSYLTLASPTHLGRFVYAVNRLLGGDESAVSVEAAEKSGPAMAKTA